MWKHLILILVRQSASTEKDFYKKHIPGKKWSTLVHFCCQQLDLQRQRVSEMSSYKNRVKGKKSRGSEHFILKITQVNGRGEHPPWPPPTHSASTSWEKMAGNGILEAIGCYCHIPAGVRRVHSRMTDLPGYDTYTHSSRHAHTQSNSKRRIP